ncbi:MAG: hypothetical protein OXI41_14760 [Chloroflexota bacterium]|nr:hypothetical protein [Chloroflexota bacterium]MDE2895832.1 hypothetical protein [Chloroflexota bacterium]
MQVAAAGRRWIVVWSALTIVLISGLLTSAQASDPILRFFGFSGDITIDGEAVGPGTVIAAMVGDEEVASTTVNQAGAWILDVSTGDLNPDSCDVTFVVDGLRAPYEWDCGDLRLRLALVSEGGAADSRESTVAADDGEQGDPDAGESPTESGDGSSQPTGASNGDSAATTDEDAGEATEQSQRLVRPATPRTGTGGVLDAPEPTNWPRAAAITALLTFGVAILALLMSGRTNSAD